APDKDDMIVFSQRSIQFYRNSTDRTAKTNNLHQITRAVIQGLYPLSDKRREYCLFFSFRDRPVNSGRKDNADLKWRSSVGDQTPNEDINNLGACRLSRGVRNDNQNAFIWPDHFLKRLRIDWLIKFRA